MDEGVFDKGRPHPLVMLTITRMRTFYREPGALFWVFGFPILLSVALGLAFRDKKPDPVVAAVAEGPGADELLAALRAGGLDAKTIPASAAREPLRSGRISVLVLAGPTGEVTMRYDPARPEARLARAMADDAIQLARGRRDPVRVKDEEVKEPGARYIDFLIPGMIGLNIMGGSLWGIGWVIVDMRVRKLLKRLLATPMKRRHFLLAQGIARMVLLPVEIVLLVIFARYAFDVRVQGSFLSLGLVSLLGAACFAGIAVLVASRAQNSQTVSGLMNVVMLPMWIFSGVFFPSTTFPEVMKPLIDAMPLTALIDALRAIMVDGASIATLVPQAVVLTAWAILGFAAGLKIFRWS